MTIKSLIIINWGNIPNKTYHFLDGLNLLVGDTGSGKSTMLDAIQTILTAAKRGLVDYNAGQGTEETRSSKKIYRTYQSYLLGGDEGRRFSRNEAKGIIACVFEDKKGNVFSAWVFGDAYLEINGKKRTPKLHEDPKLGIISNAAISIEDFLNETSDGKQVKDFSTIKYHMNEVYSNKNAEVFETKKHYLGRLYGLFRGSHKSVTENDINKMAKAFTSYIYPKEVPDAHRFVFNELLEKRDIKGIVENLSEILQRSNRLKEEAKRYESANNSVEAILNDGIKSIDAWKKLYSSRYIHSLQNMHFIEKNITSQLASIEKLQSKVKFAEGMVETLTREQSEVQGTLNKIISDIGNDVAVVQKKELVNELKDLEEKKNKSFNEVKNFFANLEKIASTLKISSSYDTTGYAETLSLELSTFISENKHKILDTVESYKYFIEHASRYSKILKSIFSLEEETSLFSRIDTTFHKLTIKSEEINVQIDLLNNERLKLERGGRVSYPSDVEDAIHLLHENMPQSKARILCENMNFEDSNWQSAIEGYLKGNRYAIIVEPEWVASATKLLKENSLYHAKILQSERLMNDIKSKGKSLAINSIVKLLSFTDLIAEAYMILSYGNVVQVDDAEMLSKTSRGLTIDGMGSSGYMNFYCGLKPHECVVGQHAKEQRLIHLNLETNVLSKKQIEIDNEISILKGPRARFNNAEKFLIDDVTLGNASILPSAYSAINKLKKDIKEIDLGEVKLLDDKRIELDLKNKSLLKDIKEYEKNEITYNTQKIAIEQSKENEENNLKIQIEKTDNEKKIFSELLIMTQSDVEFTLIKVEKEAKTINKKEVSVDFSETQKLSIEMIYKTKNHNKDEIPVAYVEYEEFDIKDSADCLMSIIKLLQTVDHVHNNIKNNLLFEKKEDVEKNNKEFMTVFMDSFCTNI